MLPVLPGGVSGCLHDADPITPQPTLPAIILTGLSEHSLSGVSKRKLFSWLVTSVLESKGEMDGPALVAFPHVFPGQSGDYWGGRDNLYFITGRGKGMVHLIFMISIGVVGGSSPVSCLVHSPVPRKKGGRGSGKLD